MQGTGVQFRPMERSGEETCWTLIEAAGSGDERAREDFATRYLPAVRAYLQARWRTQSLLDQVDDAQQEVFVECLKDGGLLERAQRGGSAGFRGYLYGAVRNVANRIEERAMLRAQRADPDSFHPEHRVADDESLSQAFDRAFALGVLRAALRLHFQRATDLGGRDLARFELLRKRFHGGRSIAAIAREEGRDATKLHHEYACARREFQEHLRAIVATHHPGATPGEVDRECELLVDLTEN